jgi:hypothetical protein
MKTSFKLLAMAAAASTFLASPVLHAESTYGYTTGTGPISATAQLEVRVTVPSLIILRIGMPDRRVPTAFLNVGPTGIPGGVSPLSTGNNQTANWNGEAPLLSDPSAGHVAYAWTNRSNATLTGAVTSPFPAGSGLTASHVLVSSSPGGTLNHPGANTGAFSSTALLPNVRAMSSWTYSLSAAGAAAATPGTHSQTVTYTASSM